MRVLLGNKVDYAIKYGTSPSIHPGPSCKEEDGSQDTDQNDHAADCDSRYRPCG
jgi:hypothetical protein